MIRKEMMIIAVKYIIIKGNMNEIIIEEESLIQASMDILLYSGDARTLIAESVCAMENNEELANEKIKEATEKLRLAHVIQTEMIQNVAKGIKLPYSPLFTHAQDTLMTINSELILVKHLFTLYKSVLRQVKNEM